MQTVLHVVEHVYASTRSAVSYACMTYFTSVTNEVSTDCCSLVLLRFELIQLELECVMGR